MGLSLFYIIAFFVFGSSDSSYFNKGHVELICQLYGLSMLFVGVLLMYFSVGKEELHQVMKDVTYSSSEERLLDDNLEQKEFKERNKVDVNVNIVLNSIHLICALFLVVGQPLFNYAYATVVVFALVYAMLWLILGVTVFSMNFQKKI